MNIYFLDKVIFVFLLWLMNGTCFSYNHVLSKPRAFTGLYSKGRRLDEEGLSQRQLFKKIRDNVADLARREGLDTLEEEPPSCVLYSLGNRDGSQIDYNADAQFLQMVLKRKEVEYDVRLIKATEIPSWIKDDYNGTLPLLTYENKTIGNALEAAYILERSIPKNSLLRVSGVSVEEALNRTSNFFDIVTRYILNKDHTLELEYRENVMKELDKIDELIRSTPGKYLCGIDVTIADLYMLPRFFQAVIGLEHFKKTTIFHMDNDVERPGFEGYLLDVFLVKEFNAKKVYFNADNVIHHWKKLRGDKIRRKSIYEDDDETENVEISTERKAGSV